MREATKKRQAPIATGALHATSRAQRSVLTLRAPPPPLPPGPPKIFVNALPVLLDERIATDAKTLIVALAEAHSVWHKEKEELGRGLSLDLHFFSTRMMPKPVKAKAEIKKEMQ